MALPVKMEITTRNQAATLRQTRYYTGEACARGHVAQRLVSNGCCVMCHRINTIKGITAQRARLRALRA
jgi:hypothetical protein